MALRISVETALFCVTVLGSPIAAESPGRPLSLSWEHEVLTIRGNHLPGKSLEIWYLEAFCRPGSSRREWKQTVIPHTTTLIDASADGRVIKLQSRLSDGVKVDHEIRAGDDEVEFRLTATNPAAVESQAHWAQPCIRVDKYADVKRQGNSEAYLPRCFVYVDGRPVRACRRRLGPRRPFTPPGKSGALPE